MHHRTCKECSAAFNPTHGRQVYCPDHQGKTRYRMVTLTCDGCGGPALKYSQKQRYASVYCSTMCRDYKRWGKQSCPIPPTHWARMYGATCRWTPPRVEREAHCEWCGTPFSTMKRQHDYCSDACKAKSRRQRRRAREHDAPGEYRYVEVMRQYQRQGFVCAYCGTKPDGLPDPEHVHPLSRGGRNDMTNIVAACRPCNSDKRDLTVAEWQIDRERRGLGPIRTDALSAAMLAGV